MRDGTVLLPDRLEHPLAAGFRDHVAQHAVIDMPSRDELVIGRPGELRETRVAADSATIMSVRP